MRNAAIANELNFTGESHLNKLFKNKHGLTAKLYKTLHFGK
ncbi:hypothetical protein SAMN05421877_105149 [Sphingobacterium lactis]|uniref:HTH araC/xylS-type domain-containing protein n=1 Tax=Sphingobacterium lactis TaxID=797291 RepID=A0A1H5XWU0_9SPHI|nr:hypothetical protein SAMN05421877_105149 [Sphingobacterium lactis]